MKILVLDCAFEPVVSLIVNNKIVEEKRAESEHNSDTFMAIIDEILNKNNLTINDIDKIALNEGPGSFTGLRVSIAIAKGLGFGADMEYLTFNTFDYVSKNNETVIVPGFANFVYIKKANGIKDCVEISSLDDNENYLTFCSALEKKLQTANKNVKKVDKNSYITILNNATSKKISELEPLYLRKSQAEIQREQKLKTSK